MGIVDNVLRFEVAYSLDDTYTALQNAAEKLEEKGFSTDMLDDDLKIVYLKTTFSAFSTSGEDIIASAAKSEKGTSVYIESVPKSRVTLSRAMDMGKNKQNVNLVKE